ncbi:hypothetical protein Q5W_22950 [Hydrogenophaga sp. PBC]|nr:hypothetical protein Q5W_22950 [Hydrogenophaga sp. PBC]
MGTAAMGIGLLTGIVQLIEWLLPKSAHERINDLLTRVWVWLEDQKAGRLMKWLRDARPVKWTIYGFFLLALVYNGVALLSDTGPTMPMIEVVIFKYGVIPGLAASAAAFLFASTLRLSDLADWITSKGSALRVIGRLTAVCIGGALMFAAALLFFYNVTQHWAPLAFVVSIAVLSFLFLPVLAFTLVWALMLAWLILVGTASVALRLAELFVRKLLEHPKGTVLAVSSLLTALGTIFRNIG